MKKLLKNHWPLIVLAAVIIYGVISWQMVAPGDELGASILLLGIMLPVAFLICGIWYGIRSDGWKCLWLFPLAFVVNLFFFSNYFTALEGADCLTALEFSLFAVFGLAIGLLIRFIRSRLA